MTFRFLPVLHFLLFSVVVFSQNALPNAETIYSGEVYFDFGEYKLRPDADSVLAEVTNLISGKQNLHIKITAHTDSIGSLVNNMALSKRRSNAIKTALTKIGVPDSLLTINTFGETKPAASNQTEEGRQRNRRATIEIIKSHPTTLLQGKVSDSETQQGLASMVIIRNKDWRDTLYTDTTGYFSKTLPIGMVVGVDVFSDCHFFGSEMTKTTPNQSPMEFRLAPVKTGSAIDLNNLYFLGGRAVLLEKSLPELPKIFRFMDSNPTMKIEIAGHVNVPNMSKVSEKSREFLLSQNRALVVYNYLIDKGISAERISYKGYGNWEMRFPNATSEREQALNRRVEMKVLEGGCD